MATAPHSKARGKGEYPRSVEKVSHLDIVDQSTLQELAGDMDYNLKIIEKELDLKIGRDADGIIIRGQDAHVDLAHDLLFQLKGLVERGERIFRGDVERAIQMLCGDRHVRLEELFRDQVKVSGKRHTIIPKTFQQKLYIESIRANDLVFGIGPAGTGKTYLAMAMATSYLVNKQVKRVILCRPAVEAGEKLGFLPGDMAEKVNPYLRPLYDALYDMVEFERVQEMVEKGIIEVAPLAFMRGRTLSNAFVILDEAQNTTPGQMKMFLTRIGFGSKCIVTGDITQIDLPRGTVSGLSEALGILKNIPGLAFVHFTEADVIRHPLVSKIVTAYDKQGIRSS